MSVKSKVYIVKKYISSRNEPTCLPTYVPTYLPA